MTAKDGTIVSEPITINLDEVHDKAVRDLEKEVVDNQDKLEVIEDNKPDDIENDKKVDESEDLVVTKEPVVDKPKVEEPKELEVVIPELPKLDTDITKSADGKVAVKDSDGKTFYFNSLDEVPDDFEPATYKEWGRAVADFADKKQADKALERQHVEALKAKQVQDEINSVTASWDRDIDVLSKGGVLPEDATERETEINNTYAYISKKIADGVIVDSFAEAHKAMKYEQLKEAEKIVQDNKNKEKKAAGARVMSGSGATSTKSKTVEPLPYGTTLEQVHARYSNLI